MKNELIRNVLKLISGSTISQALPILISPLLTRIYSPESFGVFALYTSLASLSVIATGRYELAIMIPDKKNEAVSLLSLSIFISFAVSVVLEIIFLLFGREIIDLTHNPHFEGYLLLVPVSVFFIGVYQALRYWTTRDKHFGQIVKGKIYQSGVMSGSHIILGLLKSQGLGLILGRLAGQAAAAVLLLIGAVKEIKATYRSGLSFESIKEQARKYKEYPLYNSIPALLDTLSIQAPVFFISTFFGAALLGQFNLAFTVIIGPASIIMDSISQVYFQKLTELKRNKALLKPFILKSFLTLVAIGSIPLLLIVIFAPSLFSMVFGSEWRTAGEFASILSFAYFVHFIVSPLSSVFMVQGKLKTGSVWQVLYFTTTMVIFWIGSSYDIKTMFWLYVSHEVVLYALYFYLILRTSRPNSLSSVMKG